MARVVVVGGGLGGLASAARLAKLGHEVVLLERTGRLGGCLGDVRDGAYRWDTGPASTALPAVLRDLFRKSGRPLERELELTPLPVMREHRFADGSRVALPGGSRAAQARAVDELGAGLGRAWVTYVDGLGADWELVRRHVLERPFDQAGALPEVAALLRSRESLHRRTSRALSDPRLNRLVWRAAIPPGTDPRRAPGWLAVTAYVEQRFGRWSISGGMGRLAHALETRLATRGVEVHLHSEVEDLVLLEGRAVGVHVAGSTVTADAVVYAGDPRGLPALAQRLPRSRPSALAQVTHLAIEGPPDELAPEIVLHGSSEALLTTTGQAPPGAAAWRLQSPPGVDPLGLLAAHGLDVRERVTNRIEVSPEQQLAAWGGSPWGSTVPRRAVLRTSGPRTPVPGLYVAGAHATPGRGLPYVGLSAALVAQEIGPA